LGTVFLIAFNLKGKNLTLEMEFVEIILLAIFPLPNPCQYLPNTRCPLPETMGGKKNTNLQAEKEKGSKKQRWRRPYIESHYHRRCPPLSILARLPESERPLERTHPRGAGVGRPAQP